jgi:DNA-binding response OmpR family regulator
MPRSELAGTRVLLIEDEMLVAMLLEDALAELGCEVVGPIAAIDTARQAIERERFDCALVDINLRGRPAYPLADLLDARGVPFGFVTGYDASGVDREFIRRPILSKPFSTRQLRTVLVGLSRAAHCPRPRHR